MLRRKPPVSPYRLLMRELRYVKQAAEGKRAGQLVLQTTDGGEQFLLEIDIALRDAVRSDPLRGNGKVPPAATIGPREIQMRVRSGESPQELAETCGARLEWVMRFATPVLAERVRIADEARRARARRSTTDGQAVVFGEAVDERFAAHGLDLADVRWDAYRRADGQWVVSAHWPTGAVERSAEWAFQLAARTVAPLDDAAADLLSDRPIPSLTPVQAPEPNSLSLAAAPRLVRGVVAFPNLDAPTTPLPAVAADDLFDQDAVAAPAAELVDDPDAPALPMQITEKPRRATRRSPRSSALGVAGERPQVPSWDDILLGVRRKQD